MYPTKFDVVTIMSGAYAATRGSLIIAAPLAALDDLPCCVKIT